MYIAKIMKSRINSKVDTSELDKEIATQEGELRRALALKSRLIEESDSLNPDDKHFDSMREEKHELLTILISEINIFEERQANGQWLKEIVFSLPIIGNEKLYMSLDNGNSVDMFPCTGKFFDMSLNAKKRTGKGTVDKLPRTMTI